MKFSILPAAFKAAFHFVSSAAGKADHLAGVEIRALKGQIGMAATNAVQSAYVSVNANVDKPGGAVLVPVGKLKTVVDALLDGYVEVSATESEITISQAHAKTKIKLLNRDLFPKVPTSVPEQASRLPARALKRIVAATSYIVPAQSAHVTKEFLKGLQFMAVDGRLHAAASNGALIALAEAACSTNTPWRALVPGEALDLVQACVDEDSAEARIGIDEAKTQLYVATGARVIAVQLKDMPYAELGVQLEKAGAREVLAGKPQFAIEAATFASALGRAAAFTQRVTIAYDGARDNAALGLTCVSEDGGIADRITVQAMSDTAFSITCDPNLLARVMKAVRVPTLGASIWSTRGIALRTAPGEGGVKSSHLLLAIKDSATFYGSTTADADSNQPGPGPRPEPDLQLASDPQPEPGPQPAPAAPVAPVLVAVKESA